VLPYDSRKQLEECPPAVVLRNTEQCDLIAPGLSFRTKVRLWHLRMYYAQTAQIEGLLRAHLLAATVPGQHRRWSYSIVRHLSQKPKSKENVARNNQKRTSYWDLSITLSKVQGAP
jgi:hypothetical protein